MGLRKWDDAVEHAAREPFLFGKELKPLCVSGDEAELPYETTPHCITGALKRNAKGKPAGMANDPTGCIQIDLFRYPLNGFIRWYAALLPALQQSKRFVC